MGNEKPSTKNQVLKILREMAKKEPEKTVSGENLAEITGFSRVSVWKAIQSLQNSGYEIESGKTGYRLVHERQDSVMPFEFGENEAQVVFIEETSSTMDEARKIAFERMNNPEPKVDSGLEVSYGKRAAALGRKPVIVTCDRQTDGKDRKGNKWISEKGSLAFTLVTEVSLPASKASRMVLAAQVTVANTLKALTGRSYDLKWPNEIWDETGKVGGVLDEVFVSGNRTKWINLGIGINIVNKFSRKDFLKTFMTMYKEIENKVVKYPEILVAEWNYYCSDINKKVRNSSDGFQGIFIGADDAGFGLIKNSGGDVMRLTPGESQLI
ncbi:MAG: biotin--[acetyl-CoA-carboxylase] ligase [Treponema sp.]|nr:biotin--[acetyl-CoA-carboxylase] ligase [Treponema sp.]